MFSRPKILFLVSLLFVALFYLPFEFSIFLSIYCSMYVCMYVCIYVCMYVSLSTVVLNSRDRYEKTWRPTFTRLHNSPHNIPYSGLISKKKFSTKYTKFMFLRIYFRTPDLNCRVLLLHINFGGIYFRRETAKRNIRK